MEQRAEGSQDTPHLRYAFPMPRRRKRCEQPGCAADGDWQVRVGTSQEPGRVEILCKMHYGVLIEQEHTAMLPMQ